MVRWEPAFRCTLAVAAWQAMKVDPGVYFITLEISNAYDGMTGKGFLGTSRNGVYCVGSQCRNPAVLTKLMAWACIPCVISRTAGNMTALIVTMPTAPAGRRP